MEKPGRQVLRIDQYGMSLAGGERPPEGPSGSSTVAFGQWIDVLSRIDPQRDRISSQIMSTGDNNWQFADGEIR